MIDITQPTDYSCFATSVAMITEIDVDLFRLDKEGAPDIFPSARHMGQTFAPWEARCEVDPSSVTVLEWVSLLESLGYESQVHSDLLEGLEGVLGFTYVGGPDAIWSHAVAIDKQGVVHCPTNTFTGYLARELQAAENILIGGFITIREK
jgi:hypothetical protein